MWLALICQKLGRVPSRPIASFLLPQGWGNSVIVGTYEQAFPPSAPKEGVWDDPEMAKLALAPGWSAGHRSELRVGG